MTSESVSVEKTLQEDFMAERVKEKRFNLPGHIESDLAVLAER